MVRTILSAAAVAALLAAPQVAAAQQRAARVHLAQGRPLNGPDESASGAGVRSGNITSTGETVPNPGASQGAGTTALDKGVEREDNKIQGSICKGC